MQLPQLARLRDSCGAHILDSQWFQIVVPC
jgi:hypothetical protein